MSRTTSCGPGGASSYPRRRTGCGGGQRPPSGARRDHRRVRLARPAAARAADDTAGHNHRHGQRTPRLRQPLRPTSSRVRPRWERLALAQRRRAAIPPIEVYRVGGLYFVSDGHHRVSIAAATGQHVIDAYVTEILTTVPATRKTLPAAALATAAEHPTNPARDKRAREATT
jgi:hypothetical protein